jgi:hypothetical protein
MQDAKWTTRTMTSGSIKLFSRLAAQGPVQRRAIYRREN